MNLYQWIDGTQPHYVVARTFAEAEATINRVYSYPKIDKIQLITPYIILAEGVVREEMYSYDEEDTSETNR